MRRLILHWTAGTYVPSAAEKASYHFLFDEKGKCYEGKYKPEWNLDCRDGFYAAHTGGLNTGSIGIALCGMRGYSSPTSPGEFPLTKIQAERAFEFSAKLCKKYNIKVVQEFVFTHWEAGLRFPESTSAGKIDITHLSFEPKLNGSEVCEYIRGKIRWYLGRAGCRIKNEN